MPNIPERVNSPMHKAVQNLLEKPKSKDGLKKVNSLASGLVKHTNLSRKTSSPNLTSSSSNIFNAVNAEDLMNQRLKFYNLDFDPSADEDTFTNPESRHFTRDFRYKYDVNDCIPFASNTFSQQSKYLCHVLVNLYVSIASKDLQGIIPISARDISSFKNDIEMVFGTDILHLEAADEENEDFFSQADNPNDDDPDSAHGFGSGGKINVKSSAIVNVSYWATELNKCLHFEIPVSLRKSLCQVFYKLALTKGQKINRSFFVDIFYELLETISEQTYNSYRKVLKSEGLVLDYVPLLNFFLDFLPDPESEYQKQDITNEADHTLLRVLLRLSHHARAFFDDSNDKCLTDIVQFLTSSLSPKTFSVVMPIFAGTIPYHYFENQSCMDMFNLLFSIWKNSVASAAVDVQWYQYLSDILIEGYNKLITEETPNIVSKSHIEFGEFGFLNEDQVDFIFNRLRISLIKECDVASFTIIITTLVYSINGPKMLEKVRNLMNSLETYIHPSNTGRWSGLCSKFVMTFIKIYHQRAMLEEQDFSLYRKELFLNQKTHSLMVDIFQGPIFNGSLSKHTKFATCYISSLAYLIDLNPLNKMELMDKILIEIYTPYPHSIEREIVALRQFGRIARFYCSTDIYKMHITNVVTMIINKLDPNDPDMGVPLLNCLLCILSFTPIEIICSKEKDFYSNCQPYLERHILDIKSGFHESVYTDDYKYAFEASTSLFKSIVDALMTKFFTFVSSKADETLLFKMTQLFLIMIESMDLNMFTYFCEKFMNHLFDDSSYLNCLSPNVEIVAVVTGYMVKRNNKLFKPLIESFAVSVKKEVEQYKGNVRSKELHERDNRLVFYLTVLNETFRNGMSELVANSELVESIIFTIYDNITNPPVDMISSLMVHNILASLTTTEIIDFRLFKDNCEMSSEEKWGGFTTYDKRFSKEHMDFAWHIPTDAEVNYAISLSERLLSYTTDEINRITSEEHLTTNDKDILQKNILISIHVITGFAYLIDSEFDLIKNTVQVNEKSSNKNKLSILNHVRKNSVDSSIIETGFDNEMDTSENDEDAIMVEDETEDDVNQMEVESNSYEDLKSVETTPLPGDIYEFNQAAGLGVGNGFFLGDEKISIYQINYFFGKTNAEKLSDPRYEQVHQIHKRSGEMLHSLVDFIKGKHEHNTQLLRIVFQGMKCWFIDRGRELFFSDDENGDIDIDLIENIQSLAHRFEPYTRTCLALRVSIEYKGRVMTHSTSRSPSHLEKILLRDILTLSISPYPDVSSVAQTGLTDVMKQILGSYKICINFWIDELTKSLAKNDELVTLSILQCIALKKITARLNTDYNNMNKLFTLLMKASGNTDFKIVKASEQILNLLSADIKIPSSVCQFDEAKLRDLNPNDKPLQIQVEAVSNAKNKKRTDIYNVLVEFRDSILEQMKTNQKENKDISEWKSQLFIADIMNRMQSSYEFETNLVSLQEIFNQTLSDHPEVKKNAVNAFMYVISNALVRAEIGYDVENIHKSCFSRPFVKTMDTSAPNYREYFESQINNFDDPDFFIDGKAYNGFVTLGWPLYAVSSENTGRLNLQFKADDFEILSSVAALINPEYLHSITDFLIKENESKSRFSHLNVCFFVIIIQMISLKIAVNVTYDDILNICENTFDKNLKSGIITSGEIFASLFLASKYTSKKDLIKRDEFVDKYMSQFVLKNINKDISNIFNIILWWIPSQVDIRRCKKLYEKAVLSVTEVISDELAKSHNGDHISPALISGRINFARHVLMAIPSTTKRNRELGQLFNVFNHPDEPVRKNVSNTLNLLMITDSQKSFDNVKDLIAYVSLENEDKLGTSIKIVPEWFNEILLSQFDWIFNEYETKRHFYRTTNAKDIINTEFFFRCSTVYHLFCGWVYNNFVSLPPYFDKITKFLSMLYDMKNVCTMTNIHPEVLFEQMASTTMLKPTLKTVLSVIFSCETNDCFSSAHGLKVQLQFIENLYSMYIYILTKEQILDIVAFVKNLLYFKQSLEVRELAGKVLSGIVHTMGDDTPLIKELCLVFEKQLRKAGSSLNDKADYVNKSKKREAQIHGAVIGMSSVINAFPYIQPIPQWIPENLSVLSRWTRFTGFIGTATKNSLSDFKKNRNDTWHLDKENFTIDQLEDLEGVNWRSYYA
ncbi:hypothetical protein QEN19_003863 [Hanseniaspora menglaensis]